MTDDLADSRGPVQTLVHVPTPGDHYSPATGSAIMTIVYEMARAHALRGGHTKVIVSRGTRHDYPVGECIEVAATAPPKRWQKLIDVALGRIRAPRLFGQASYKPMSAVLPLGIDCPILIHNNPVAVPLFAKRHPRAKVCLWANNELFSTYAPSEIRRIADASYRWIACSEYIAEDMRRRLHTGHEKVCVVRNGVDVEKFRPGELLPSDAVPIILFVGRVVPVKGVDLLIKAALLLSPTQSFSIRIIGSSGFSATAPLTDYEKEIRRLAEPLGERVEFLPFVDRDHVIEQFRSASIFCAPSNWDDPCPLTVIEAMSCGLPVIASARGGIPELGGETTLYFKPPDVRTFADHLKHLLEDPQDRLNRGRKARERAESSSWGARYLTLSRAVMAQ